MSGLYAEEPHALSITDNEPDTLSSKKFGSKWAPSRFLTDYGDGLARMDDSAEYDFWHQDASLRIELKAARRNRRGQYIFQYIRPASFDICVCLGYNQGSCEYWLFTSNQIRKFLVRQQRNQQVYQLRVSATSRPRLATYACRPSELRHRLDKLAKRVRGSRKHIRLCPPLDLVEGWASVAAAMERKLRQLGLMDWEIVVRPLSADEMSDDMQHDPNLLPYPQFFPKEGRMEISVRPEPVIGRQNVAATSWSIVDFLLQYWEATHGISNDDPYPDGDEF